MGEHPKDQHFHVKNGNFFTQLNSIKIRHLPHFDEQLQIVQACSLMGFGDPIYANTDRLQRIQTSIHASDAMLHLQPHLHESDSITVLASS